MLGREKKNGVEMLQVMWSIPKALLWKQYKMIPFSVRPKPVTEVNR
jgi:hypothetical protein